MWIERSIFFRVFIWWQIVPRCAFIWAYKSDHLTVCRVVGLPPPKMFVEPSFYRVHKIAYFDVLRYCGTCYFLLLNCICLCTHSKPAYERIDKCKWKIEAAGLLFKCFWWSKYSQKIMKNSSCLFSSNVWVSKLSREFKRINFEKSEFF